MYAANGIVFRWTTEEIRALRLALRMTIREFAAKLGVTTRAISYWEAGEAPLARHVVLLDTLLSLCDADVLTRFHGWPMRLNAHDHGPLFATGAGWTVRVPVSVLPLSVAQQVAATMVRAATWLESDVIALADVTVAQRAGQDRRAFRALCLAPLGEGDALCRSPLGHWGECEP